MMLSNRGIHIGRGAKKATRKIHKSKACTTRREWLPCWLRCSLKGDVIICLMYVERKYQRRGKECMSTRIILTWKQMAVNWAWKWDRTGRKARNAFPASEQWVRRGEQERSKQWQHQSGFRMGASRWSLWKSSSPAFSCRVAVLAGATASRSREAGAVGPAFLYRLVCLPRVMTLWDLVIIASKQL